MIRSPNDGPDFGTFVTALIVGGFALAMIGAYVCMMAAFVQRVLG